MEESIKDMVYRRVDKNDYSPLSNTQLGRELAEDKIGSYSNDAEKIGSMYPEDIAILSDFFRLNMRDVIYDSDINDKVKYIYKNFKNTDMNLFDYLMDISLKVGGRFSSDFLDKIVVYLELQTIRDQELNRLHNISKQIEQLNA